MGGRQAGMAGCGLTTVDPWAAHHNQAALAYLDKPAIGLFAENRFGLSELGLQAGTFAYPTSSGVFALTLSHFGYELYNESKVGVGFAKAFGKRFSLGVQLGYINKHFGDVYGNNGAPVAEIGFFAQPYDNFFIGAHIFNLTRSKIADYNDERLPTIIRLGVGLKLSERVLLTTEGEKDIQTKMTFRAGIEYLFMDQLFIRSGITANPNEISFGLGYKTKRIRADIAFTTHQILGISPHFGFVYLLNGK
ncbi:MAG: hypothetical protein CVU05_11655 [Bacteroidetes bacterium HGW-Bacteroidetes-21]|nr:MAG: hypothetical protein CVU05_11655 [Bacteroidetes bacterium HGW-Bacteroidetes-21]